jgi:hypothetical protein
VLVSQDGGNTWLTVGTQLGQIAGVTGQGWIALQNGNLYLGTSAGIYTIPTASITPCSEMTMFPSSLPFPAARGLIRRWATLDLPGAGLQRCA